MLHHWHTDQLFPKLEPGWLARLQPQGTVRALADNEVAFRQAETPYAFWVILHGKLRVHKTIGGQSVILADHEAGEFAADITLLTCGLTPVTGTAVGPTELLEIPAFKFRQLLADCDEAILTIVEALIERTRDFESRIRLREKSLATTSLAAGLAHEINNPAAALLSSAGNLARQLHLLRDHAVPHTVQQSGAPLFAAEPLDAITRFDAEATIEEELVRQQIPDAAAWTTILLDAGLTPHSLQALPSGLSLAHLQTLALTQLLLESAGELQQSARRIGNIVQSMKTYSNLDRAPMLRGSLHPSLEAALQISACRQPRPDCVVLRFDPQLPSVLHWPGEICQAWSCLIQNAFDAIAASGSLTISTGSSATHVWVEFQDSGTGIAPEHLPRIFDPFFTTKAPGQGLGMGLDIARRIIEHLHCGSVDARSHRGLSPRKNETTFRVMLPR